MRPRRALLLLLFMEASLSALGTPCIRDSTTRPVFSHSAGDFFPGEETTPATCAIQCAVFKLPYVGVDEAANCFCAATIEGLEILDETKECNLKCLGGEPCGEGPGVLSVWNVKDLTGPIFVPYFRLMFTGSANNQMDVTVGTPVDITIKTTESAMLFTLNFGDGSGFRNLNSETSNTTSHTFTMEGEYYITAKEPSTGVLDMVKVVVRGPKNALGLDCPDLAAIGEPFICTFTLLRGSGSTLMLLAQETGLEHNYSLPDLETKVYGHSWSSEVSPVSSQEVNSCASNYVLDTAVIMEDEYLTVVDGWMASESTVYANTMREKCVNGGVPACPMEGEWTCTPPMYLCGASCRESSLSTCSGGTNTTLKGWTDYTAVTVATINMPFGYSDMAVPLTPLKPQSFFSVGCITEPFTSSPSAKVMYRDADTSNTQGDAMFGTALSPTFLLEFREPKNFLLRFKTLGGRVTAMGPSWTCTKPAAKPVTDFTGLNSKALVIESYWTMDFQIPGGVVPGDATVTSSHTIRCQTPITAPEGFLESIGSMSSTMVAVSLLTGAPVSLELVVQDGDDTQIWNYVDVVPDGGETYYMEYTPPRTGHFSASVRAWNLLNYTDLIVGVSVIPTILEDEWEVVSVMPWATPPGNVTLTLSCLGSDDPPWTANSSLTDGTGGVQLVEVDPDDQATAGFTFSSNFTLTLPHLAVGIHTLTVNFSNEVSWVTLPVTVDMREAIANISAIIGILVEEGGVPLPPGELDGLPVIPSMVPIVFFPTAVKGIPLYWGLFDENDDALNMTETKDQTLHYYFTNEGLRNLTVKAYAEAEGWVAADQPLKFQVLNKIQGLSITDYNIISPAGQSKLFSVSLEVFHPITCLIIDYNDGSPGEVYGASSLCQTKYPTAAYMGGPITNPFNLTHVYQQENLYNVTVIMEDLLIILRQRLPVVVANLPCKAPKVWLPKNVSTPLEAPVVMRSRPLRVTAEAHVECNGTVATKKSWTVTKVEGEDAKPVEDILVEGILSSWNFSELSVPVRFLDYGTYLFTYRLQLLASKIFPLFRTTSTYYTVTKTPLQAVIIKGGMSKVSCGYAKSLVLDPHQYSQDPDWPDIKNFTYTWFCRSLTDPGHPMDAEGRPTAYNMHAIPTPLAAAGSTGGGCFGNGPGTLDYSLGLLNLDTSSFTHPDKTYEIQVMIKKDTRFAVARVLVEVMKLSPPSIDIKCADPKLCMPTFDGLLVNPSSRVALQSVCSDNCHSDMQYSWNITTFTGEPVVEEVDCSTPSVTTPSPDGEASLSPDPCPPVVPTGKYSKDIAVGSGLFLMNPGIEKFKLTLTVTTPSGARGEYVMTLVLNKPPTGGSCNINPAVGFALTYKFHIECSGWADPEEAGVDQYVIFMYVETDGAPLKETIVSATNPKADLILPIGIFTIYCEIWDKFGTYVEVEVGSVMVQLPSEEDVMAFATTDQIEYLAAIGDQFTIGMMLKAQASVREHAPWLSLNMDTLGNLTADEMDNRLKDVAKMNTEALKAAANTMTPGNLAQLNVMAGVMRTSVDGIDKAEAAAKTVDMEARETALELLETMTDSLDKIEVTSPQDLVPFLASSLSAMGSIMSGVRRIIEGENVTNVPPTDTEAAVNWDYETDIGDDLDLEIPLSKTEMLQQNVIDTTRRKAEQQINQMMEVVHKIGRAMENRSVEGEVVLAQAPNGAAMMVAKMSEEVLRAGMKVAVTKGGGNVQLPRGFCPSSYQGKEGCNRSFSITAVEWPGITHSYAPTSEQLSKKTRVVSLDVFLEGGLVNAFNVNDGILIDILRGAEQLPEPVLVTGTEARSRMGPQPLVYHSFNVTNNNAAVNIEISVNGSMGPRLMVLICHKSLPTPTSYDVLRHVETIPTNDLGVHDLFLGGSTIRNRTGRFFLAMAVLKEGTDAAALNAGTTNLTSDMLSWDVDGTYSLRIFTSGCYFFNDTARSWTNNGLEVVSATYRNTQCRSSHLTSFGSRFFPTPNSIRFDFIFAHAGFLDNTAIYVTLAITVCLFLCLLVWAKIKDKTDIKKRGVAPLPDNNVKDRYLYEIVVYTGSDNEASCESKVQIILSGECGESEVRTLEDKERKIFCRNGIDSFVMAEPRPLGDLQYLRIWHDNSGEGIFASWQLAFVSVRDLQTQHKTLFIANRWLALDHDDGEIDVTLSSSSMDELTNFSHLYEANKQRGIKDRHIWFSVFFRPPRSRYTRVERTAVCAGFVYLSMLCSAMWYSTIPDEPMGQGFFVLGPFSLTTEKASVGLASLLVVYPVIQLIIWLYRTSQPRVKPYSRAFTARHDQQQCQREDVGLPREEPEQHTKTKHVLSLTNTDERHERPFVLGWWGRALAWLLVLAVIGISVFFVWAYALQFGAEKTSRWLTSLIVTFLMSILVVEPLMVLFGAAVTASCCKRKEFWAVDADDIDFDEVEPDLEMDEEWQHLEPLDPTYPRKVHSIPGNKDTSMLDELRVKIVKEREMTLVLRDVGAYFIFVFMVMILTYGERDESSYRMVANFRNAFIKEGDIKWDYTNKVKTSDHYWRWLKEIMLTELRAQNWYNNDPPYGLRGYLDDRANRIMGYAILRQVRNKNTCRPSNQIKNLVSECSGWRGLFLEDTQDYCAHWTTTAAFDKACDVPEFRYKTADELQSFTSSGRLGSYSGGGYVLALRGSTQEILDRLNYLQKIGWIDRFTRTVMLEFSVYNTNVNLFGIATIMAEFHPGGGIRPYWRFDASPFIRNAGAFGMFILLNEIGFVLATIFFTFKEFWKCYKSGITTYFSSYWNMAETSIIIISYAAIALYILRYLEVQRVLEVFNITFGNGYVRMEYAALLDLYLLYAVGFIVFFTTVKFIKLLQFNKRINLLGLTLSHCWDDLQVFFLTFGVIFFSFTTLFFTIFNLQLEEFASLLAALQMSFAMMLGKFDFEKMTMANSLSPVMFFIFSLSTSMILINLMLTIIIRTFTKIKNDLKNKPNKYDIIDYVTNKTMILLNLRTEKPLPRVSPPVLDNTASQTQDTSASTEFPEKVDVLLAYINEMYFNGKMDLSDPYNKKSMMGGKSAKLYGKSSGI